MKYLPSCGLLLFVLFVACACISLHSVNSRVDEATTIATQAGLVSRVIDTGTFDIQTWYRGANPHNDHLQVYIEGDGLAWRRKHRLSDNPTPVDPLALRLAARAGAVPVLYLARPCQYTADISRGRCPAEYWSSHRYSGAVVDAMNEVIDRYTQEADASTITLVGYSGGGVVAALLAARRKDVKRLVTVAANLDHRVWTDLHRVSPLSGSLNPVNFAGELRGISQLHLVGGDDEVVTDAVVRSYVDKLGDTDKARIRVLPGFDHDCCWAEAWPGLIKGPE